MRRKGIAQRVSSAQESRASRETYEFGTLPAARLGQAWFDFSGGAPVEAERLTTALPGFAAALAVLAAALAMDEASRLASMQSFLAPDSFHQSKCSSETPLILQGCSEEVSHALTGRSPADAHSPSLELAVTGRLVLRDVLKRGERNDSVGVDVVFVRGLRRPGSASREETGDRHRATHLFAQVEQERKESIGRLGTRCCARDGRRADDAATVVVPVRRSRSTPGTDSSRKQAEVTHHSGSAPS